MTDHENQYDPQLQWVIDEVIFYITQQKHSDPVWFDVYETITGSTADEAWDEYQATLRADAEGEARFEQERDDEI
tara:strand:+ start:2549 stop:2773 length:225 start_codon:yes stop_codon:yes gene_type:complete